MKKLITVLIISVSSLSYFATLAQGISVEPSRIKLNSSTFIYPFNNADPSFIINGIHPTFRPSLTLLHNTNPIGTITGSPTRDFRFYTNQGYEFQVLANTNYINAIRITPNDGYVGIKTVSEPTSTLEVNGFTKLGSDAPAIKLKKLTSGCITSANSGFPSGEISLTHGITPSKILKVEALVEYATNFWVKDGNDLFGYEFDVYVTNTTISLRNLSGSASSEIRSKPCKILITYEE